MACLTATHWAFLNYCILFVANVSLASQGPVWNLGAARSIIKLEVYLDIVSAIVKKLSSSVNPPGGPSNWYESLLRRWEAIKGAYMMAYQRSRLEVASSASAAQSEIPPDIEAINIPIQGNQTWQCDTNLHSSDGIFQSVADFELLDFPCDFGPWVSPQEGPQINGPRMF